MGALDQTVRQLILVKGDTSDAKAAIRSLRGEEKKAHQERLAEIEGQNKKIDGQIATWVKLGVAVGASVAAYKLAQGAVKAYLEDLRLESAAAGANIKKLTDATAGLIEHDKLLEFAGKAMHGTWKLNQEEMEKVLHGALALRKTMGVELEPTIDSLTEAISKGATKSLHEFGITATDKQGVLKQLDALFQGLHGDTALAGDEFERSGIKLHDAMDDLKGAIGKLVISLSPLLDSLATFVGYLTQIANFSNSYAGVTKDFAMKDPRVRAYFMAQQQQAYIAAGRGLLSAGQGAFDTFAGMFQGGQVAKAGGRRSGASSGSTVEIGDILPLILAIRQIPGAAYGAASSVFQGGQQAYLSGRYGNLAGTPESQAYLQQLNEMNLSAASMSAQVHMPGRLEHEKYLESLFGPLSEFNAYAQGFQMLQGAASSAFDAWITGSESIPKAFKKAIGEAIRALANQMFVESLKHAAYALGSLAFGDFRGAAQHGEAAAAFGAGAVVAGGIAKTLGAGQSQPGRGGGGGSAATSGGRSGGGAGADGGDHTTVILLGPGYLGFTPLEEREFMQRAITLGRSRGASRRVRH